MQHVSPESAVKHADLIAVASQGAGAVSGTSFDTKGLGDVIASLRSGTNQATGTLDVAWEDSDDNASFAALLDNSAVQVKFTQVTTATDNANYRILLREGSHRRYIRPVGTVGTAACVYGVDVEGYSPQRSEQADGESAFQTIYSAKTTTTT